MAASPGSAGFLRSVLLGVLYADTVDEVDFVTEDGDVPDR